MWPKLKRAHGADSQPSQSSREKPARAERTRVNALSTKALIAGFYGLVALGAVGGVVGLSSDSGEAATEIAHVEQVSTTPAEGAAAAYIVSWLSATQSDQSLVRQLTGSSLPVAPYNPVEFSAVTVADVQHSPEEDFVAVTISAALTAAGSDSAESDSEGEAGNERSKPVTTVQYWQVMVQLTEGRAQVVGYPTPVPAPELSEERVRLGYSERVTSNSELAETLDGFARSYASGEGDARRYVSSDSKIRGITPAPYTDVSIREILASQDPTEIASQTPLRVIVQAEGQLSSSSGDRQAITLALTVHEREGRWEVKTIDPSPVIARPTD